MLKFIVVLSIIANLSATSLNTFIFPKLPNYVENSKNKICNAHSLLYKQHLANYTFWAHEMQDSSSKHNTGLLRGNKLELGNFYQCISVEAPFMAQYCLADVTAHVPTSNFTRDPLSLYFAPYESVFNRVRETNDHFQISRHSVKFGLCLPASCSARDLQDYLNKVVANATVPVVTYDVHVAPNLCQRQDYEKRLDSWDIAFCSITLLILTLVIGATILDYSEEISKAKSGNKVSKMRSLLLTFSAKKNFVELTKCPNSTSPLAVLNGMRTFAICVIIILHRFLHSLPIALKNYDYIEKEYRTLHTAFLFHSDLFVDSFFMFSGILAAYLLLLEKITNPFIIITGRYFRLTPAYAFVILYYASVFFYTGSGPFWNLIIGKEMTNCRENWWTSLLYINNYVNSDHLCIAQSWYLPCDFHFFIIGVIVIFAIKKKKKLGLSLLGVLLAASIIIPSVITTLNSEAPMIYFDRSFLEGVRNNHYFTTMYIKSHIRATPYIMGLITGYIFYKRRENQTKLSKLTSNVLAGVSLIIINLCLLSSSIFYNVYHPYNAVEAGAHAGFHTLPWALGTAGLIISTSYGKVTVLKAVLSWRLWSPLAKLSYSAFLLHMQFPVRSFGGLVDTTYWSYFNLFHLALGDITLTFFLSLLLYLGVEAPCQRMIKMLLKRKVEPDIVQKNRSENCDSRDSNL